MMQRLHTALIIALFAAQTTVAQEVFTAAPLIDLDQVNGWMSGLRSDAVIMHEQRSDGAFISDEGRSRIRREYTVRYSRGNTWNAYDGEGEVLALPMVSDFPVGTLSSVGDSAVVFSLMDDFGEWRAGSVVMARYNRGLLDQMEVLVNAPSKGRHLHPTLSEDGLQVVFASNMPGGAGGFDLYYVNKLSVGWSDPISLGAAVNTPGDEVFPSWRGTSVYFSSDGHPGMGKLDVYRASREHQWQEVQALPAPFNSSGDDFLPLWLGADDCLMNSDREGVDRVYRLVRERKNPLATGLRAELICAGTPVQGARVIITNDLDEWVLDKQTGDKGGFDVGALELKRTYRARFENAPAAVLDRSLLYILNENGERVMVFAPNRNGLFMFELMPFSELNALQVIQNDDDSRLLSVAIEGQVFEVNPGDIGSGEVIYLEGPDGALTALTYTTDGGYFRFNELSPEMSYNFRFDEERNQLRLVINDRGSEQELAVVNGRARFVRVKDEEALRLNNERGEPIVIRADEGFIARNIYYAFNSVELNDDARAELSRLVIILKNNPGLTVDLSSHTDSRGTEAFNKELSDRRAAGCVAYLTNRGIDPRRLMATGYGENQLVNHCTDDADCDEEEHAVNRRTELRLR